MDILKLISIAVSSLIIIVLLRKINNEYAVLASCMLNISICIFSVAILSPVFDYIKNIGGGASYGYLCSLMFKCTGICLLSSLAGEICRDCQEAGLGAKIEFAGRCTLIVLALPLIKKVFENATTFLG